MLRFYFFFAALALGGCVTTNEPVLDRPATRAERQTVYQLFGNADACLERVYNTEPDATIQRRMSACECIRAEFANNIADPLAIWIARAGRSAATTPMPPSLEALTMQDFPRVIPAAYRQCGVRYEAP